MEKYRVQNKLGEGAFGSVYLVADDNDALYAMKSVKLNPFEREDQQKEIEISKHLKHPNIIEMIQNGCDEDTLHMVLEYCSQGHLGKFSVHPQQKLPHKKILNILKNIVNAGLFMNEQGIIHRDLKPENILLHEDGSPKLIDFGCAKKLSPDEIYDPSNESYDKGTTIYASPEELKSQKYSAKCDIWSLGCIGYELTYGEHFWSSQTEDQIIEHLKSDSFNKRKIVKQNTDPRIAKFMEMTLQEKQKQRATWKQLALSRIFEEQVQDQENFLYYLDELMKIAKWTIKQLREIKNQLGESKDKAKILLFFMIKMCMSLYDMKISLLEKEKKYEYLLEHPENVKRSPDMLRQLKFQQIQLKEGYQKLYANIKDKKYFQKVQKQIGEKRTSFFIDLDNVIRYGRKLLNEILRNRTTLQSQEEVKLFTSLTKWVNFNIWLSYEQKPSLGSIIQPQSNLYPWMQSQLSIL